MKSYIDIEQSKKLVEILLLESADMKWFIPADNEGEFIEEVSLINNKSEYTLFDKVTDWNDTPYIPCWSLSALLSVLPNGTRVLKSVTGDTYHCDCPKRTINKWYDNPVDACYEIILKLNKLKML